MGFLLSFSTQGDPKKEFIAMGISKQFLYNNLCTGAGGKYMPVGRVLLNERIANNGVCAFTTDTGNSARGADIGAIGGAAPPTTVAGGVTDRIVLGLFLPCGGIVRGQYARLDYRIGVYGATYGGRCYYDTLLLGTGDTAAVAGLRKRYYRAQRCQRGYLLVG